MSSTSVQSPFKVSAMAENLIGSEILKLAGEVHEKIRQGEQIYNLTIGDFNPELFPIPTAFRDEIITAYHNNLTNYPPADGLLSLRQEVSAFLQKYSGLEYAPDEILIAGGARPIIYATYQALVNPGEAILFPVPSWNNNHYTHLLNARQILVETTHEDNFMPTADELRPHIKEAALVALCSPLNPTGTVFSRESLTDICDMILEENARRAESSEKPVYLLYDQIYWMLTLGETKHFDPVSLRPAMRDFTVFVDGMSKAFAATGVRVGWGFGPKRIMDKMKAIVGHIGAWSPKAEQAAAAAYLKREAEVDDYLTAFKTAVSDRLHGFYDGFMTLKNEGFPVDAIAPQAAIYLTVQIDIRGKITPEGKTLQTPADATKYLLDTAKIAIVPFTAFGSSSDSTWYRISVGTCALEEVPGIIANLRQALSVLG